MYGLHAILYNYSIFNIIVDNFPSSSWSLRIRTCKANYRVNDLENERGISFLSPMGYESVLPSSNLFLILSYFSSTFFLISIKRKKMNVSISFLVSTKNRARNNIPYSCYLHLSPMGMCTNTRLTTLMYKNCRKHPHTLYVYRCDLINC